MTSLLFSVAIALALIFHLVHHAKTARANAAMAKASSSASVLAVVPDARETDDFTAGVSGWAGTWMNQRVHIRTIADTLATRKLPVLWLSVTITEKVAVPAIFDLMMRPGSPTTFSNFDHLAATLPDQPGFPSGAVIRTSEESAVFPLHVIAGHIDLFADGRAKELLVTPHGIRIVWLLAEADRVRYGVFRQAAFSGTGPDAAILETLLVSATALRSAINAEAAQVAA